MYICESVIGGSIPRFCYFNLKKKKKNSGVMEEEGEKSLGFFFFLAKIVLNTNFWGLILEKFKGFDLFVVYLNENFSFWNLNDLFAVYSKIRI